MSTKTSTQKVSSVPAPQESFAMRLQGGIALTTYSATFSSSQDVIDCGQLDFGNGAGPAFNAVFEFRLGDTWGIGAGIGYSGRSGQFKRTNVYPIRDTISNAETELTTTMALEPTAEFLELQPDVRIALLGKYETRSLGLVIGPRFALPLSTRFVQHETIISPGNAAFVVNGLRTQQRTIAAGVLGTRSSVLVGGSASLESFITLSNNITLVPQLSFDYFATSMLTDADWTMLGVRAEIGIRFGFRPKPDTLTRKIPHVAPPPPVVINAPPSPPSTPPGNERPPVIELLQPTYTAEVVTGDKLTATTPIVNAVFFDSATAALHANYLRTNDGTLPSSDPVQAHAWVLVRIADILRRNPQGNITLEGATSGADEADVDGSVGDNNGRQSAVQLAERRAQTVKKAFVELGVDPSRIQTRALITPRIPSNQEYVGGREENRRVDINVSNAPLQEWVSVQQFSDVRGMMQVNATPINSVGSTMRIRVGTSDTVVSKTDGNISVPFTAPIPAGSTIASVRVIAEAGSAFSERTAVIDASNLTRRTVNLKTNKFEAILRFDYNSSELNEDVKTLLRQLTERLPNGSAITIYGSTDALGTDTRNKELSEQRASVTEQYIRSLIGNKFTIETSTSGERFADLTPQGRFLNRNIRITVRTK